MIKFEIERELEPRLTVKTNQTKNGGERSLDLYLILGEIYGSFRVKWNKAVYLKQDNGQQIRYGNFANLSLFLKKII